MTLAIVYERELALVLSVVLTLMITVCLGQTLAEFIILNSAVAGPILMVNRIRSRSKLIYVGLAGGLVVFVTTLGVGILAGQTFGLAHTTNFGPGGYRSGFSHAAFLARLVSGAGLLGLCVVLAGFLMTGLLPFIERLFDVQTDISLLELGDAAHPLLQQLAQRAPGTYNHSINVASLAEPAAEAIGGNGLLVRVGAYFHDIGKMLKPDYFVENQCEQRQPARVPAAGDEHAGDHRPCQGRRGPGPAAPLPQSVIDFIEQHHGTTLVEYFYRQAERRSQDNAATTMRSTSRASAIPAPNRRPRKPPC